MSNCLKFSNYPIDVDTNVPHHLRNSNPNNF